MDIEIRTLKHQISDKDRQNDELKCEVADLRCEMADLKCHVAELSRLLEVRFGEKIMTRTSKALQQNSR